METDCDSDIELSPEIQIKKRKRVFTQTPLQQQDTSHTFQINEERSTVTNTEISQKFCRASYVQDVLSTDDLLCCVLSTFTLDLSAMLNEMPDLFGPTAGVDCLVVYGKLASNRPLPGEMLPKLSSYLHLDEVSPQHQRSSHMGLAQSPAHILGVHHPKYMLLFTSKGLHVIITTSNLTPSQNSTDISWVQFFPVQVNWRSDRSDPIGNDFGEVLEDFLAQQSRQVRHSASFSGGPPSAQRWGPFEFVWHRLQALHGRQEGATLSKLFAFHEAKVHLVTTVPGRFALPSWLSHSCSPSPTKLRELPCIACAHRRDRISRRTFASSPLHNCEWDCAGDVAYGAWRLHTLLRGPCSRLLPRELDCRDSLVLQPTSIGAGITTTYMAELLALYMPESYWDEGRECDRADRLFSQPEAVRSDHTKVIWPSDNFMRRCHIQRVSPSHKAFAPPACGDSQELDNDAAGHTISLLGDNEQVFCVPKNLMQMGWDIQTQLHLYAPLQGPGMRVKAPHIKTYIRLLGDKDKVAAAGSCCGSTGGHRSSEEKEMTSSCVCPDIAWLLLTSACLSKGAQGEIVPPSICSECGHLREGYFEYKNFEIGVLFHSDYSTYAHPSETLPTRARCPVHSLHKVSRGPLDCEVAMSDLPTTCATRKRQRLSPEDDFSLSIGSLGVESAGNYPSERVVVLPLPFEADDTCPYVGADGQFQHQPYFHDTSEINKYCLFVPNTAPAKAVNMSTLNTFVSIEPAEAEPPVRPMHRHKSFRADYAPLLHPIMGLREAADSSVKVKKVGEGRHNTVRMAQQSASDYLCD